MGHTIVKKEEYSSKLKKVIIGTAILAVTLIAILILPLKATNVTLQLHVKNLDNGTKVKFIIENNKGDENVTQVRVYNGRAEIRLDPKYYDLALLQLDTSDINAELDAASIYSGTYDASQDKQLDNVEIGEDQCTISEDGKITVHNDITGMLSDRLKSGIQLKVYLYLFIALIYVLYLVHTLRQGILLKYVEYALWFIIGVIILTGLSGNVFHLPDSFNASASVGISTEELSEMALDSTVVGEFTAKDDKLKKIQIDFLYDENSVYEDLGVSIIDKAGNEYIYSHVFESAALEGRKSIYAVLNSAIRDSKDKVYQVVIEPLDENVNTTIKVWEDTRQEEDVIALTSFYDSSFVNTVLLFASIIGLLGLAALAFGYKDFRLTPKMAVGLVYIGIICYMIVQIFYYGKYIGYTPDEQGHMSYVQYLMDNRTLIPDFSDMHMYQFGNGAAIMQDSTNYLGHPPLYYWILAIVQMLFGRAQVNITLLRLSSAAMAVLAVCICFYVGYTRINKSRPYVHLVYALGIISVPFLTYGFSGVNNDTLSFLGVSLAFWGILRFEEKKRGYSTYLLLAVGMFFVVMSKLTAGLVLGIAYIIYIVYTCLNEKSLKCVFNKACLLVIPFILVIAVYFAVIIITYGGYQPSLEHLNPSEYAASVFYVKLEDRRNYSIGEYIQYFWNMFLRSWSEISSHVSISKTTQWYGIDRIIYLIMGISPIFLMKIKDKVKGGRFCLSIFAGMVLAIIMQFYNAFQRFYYASGYPGGFQSRYYLCWIPIMAFAFASLFSYFEEKKNINSAILRTIRIGAFVSVLLMGYGSFIYSLLVGKN